MGEEQLTKRLEEVMADAYNHYDTGTLYEKDLDQRAYYDFQDARQQDILDLAQQDKERRDWDKSLAKREADLQKALNDYNKSKKQKDLAHKDLYLDNSSDSYYYSEDEMNDFSFEDEIPVIPVRHKKKSKKAKKKKTKDIQQLPPVNIKMQRYEDQRIQNPQ